MNLDSAIDALREKSKQANELHRLRDRVEELERLLGIVAEDDVDRFIAMKLTPTERSILNIFFIWTVVRREQLHTLLYGSRLECDQPDTDQVLDVYVSRLRKYLSGFEIVINTERSKGWFMTPENKKKLELLAEWLQSRGTT